MLLFGLLVPVLGVVAEVAGEVVPPPGDAVSVQHVRRLGWVRHSGTVGFKCLKLSNVVNLEVIIPGVRGHEDGTGCNEEKRLHI